MCNFCGYFQCSTCIPTRKRSSPKVKDGSGTRYNICGKCDIKYLNLQLSHSYVENKTLLQQAIAKTTNELEELLNKVNNINVLTQQKTKLRQRNKMRISQLKKEKLDWSKRLSSNASIDQQIKKKQQQSKQLQQKHAQLSKKYNHFLCWKKQKEEQLQNKQKQEHQRLLQQIEKQQADESRRQLQQQLQQEERQKQKIELQRTQRQNRELKERLQREQLQRQHQKQQMQQKQRQRQRQRRIQLQRQRQQQIMLALKQKQAKQQKQQEEQVEQWITRNSNNNNKYNDKNQQQEDNDLDDNDNDDEMMNYFQNQQQQQKNGNFDNVNGDGDQNADGDGNNNHNDENIAKQQIFSFKPKISQSNLQKTLIEEEEITEPTTTLLLSGQQTKTNQQEEENIYQNQQIDQNPNKQQPQTNDVFTFQDRNRVQPQTQSDIHQQDDDDVQNNFYYHLQKQRQKRLTHQGTVTSKLDDIQIQVGWEKRQHQNKSQCQQNRLTCQKQAIHNTQLQDGEKSQLDPEEFENAKHQLIKAASIRAKKNKMPWQQEEEQGHNSVQQKKCQCSIY